MLSHSVIPILCDPVDCSMPGSSVHGTFQAKIMEWVAISPSMGSSSPRHHDCFHLLFPFLRSLFDLKSVYLYQRVFLVIKSLASITYLMHNLMVFYWGKKSRLRKEKHKYTWRVSRGG